MEVFRITKSKYSKGLSGKGAAINGARWNSRDIEIIYTAANRSLAMAEVVVGLNIAAMKVTFCMKTIYLSSNCPIKTINLNELPPNWNAIPAIDNTRFIGDAFISEGHHLALRVPSVVTQGDWNYLINAIHPEFNKVQILEVNEFPFDRRMF